LTAPSWFATLRERRVYGGTRVTEKEARAATLSELEKLLMQSGRLFGAHTPGGPTPTQFMVLRWLAERGPMHMGELADALDISMAGATGLVDRMVHSRLLERQRSETDRRLVMVRVTTAGREALEMVRRRRFEMFRAVTEELSLEDLQHFERILRRIIDVSRQAGATT
jgi:DNA-binding MarR family transcriptional regulator